MKLIFITNPSCLVKTIIGKGGFPGTFLITCLLAQLPGIPLDARQEVATAIGGDKMGRNGAILSLI